jgi:hypothetical protein
MNMHAERGWSRAHQMIVNRSDFDAAFHQLAHDWINLGLDEHEVPHDHGTILHWLEAEPSAERQSRFYCDAVNCHLEIGAWNRVAVDFALYRSRLAKRRIDFGPV